MGYRVTVGQRVVGAILAALLPLATWADDGWLKDPTVQQELADGDVAVRFVFEGDGSRMRVRAAVRINATAQAIWSVLTDCDHAASFIPGVKRCQRIRSAPDGSWEILEQEARYSWLMPAVTCIFRADYKPPSRIDFKRISGDLKQEEGHWVLENPTPDAQSRRASAPVTSRVDVATSGIQLGAQPPHDASTVVEYELYVDPGFWIPRVLLRHSLRSELPAALKAVRTRAESAAAEG